jgi:TPR repeat protein
VKSVGVTPDDSQSVAYFRKAAEQGQVGAQFRLGIMLAFYWYNLAAEQGDAFAQCNLANMYYSVTRDVEKAAYWFKLAAEQGYHLAQCNFGILHLEAFQDKEATIYWFKLAAEQGNDQARRFLEELELPGYKVSFSKADTCAEDGNWREAVIHLNDCLQSNPDQAIKFCAVAIYIEAMDKLNGNEEETKFSNIVLL